MIATVKNDDDDLFVVDFHQVKEKLVRYLPRTSYVYVHTKHVGRMLLQNDEASIKLF